jgi:hypothetical protein
MKATTKGALNALLRNMSQEDWFNNPLTRTMSLSVTWMNRELSQLVGSKRRQDLELVMNYVAEELLPGSFTQEWLVSKTAGFVLEAVSFGTVGPVTDMASLLNHLVSTSGRMTEPVLLTGRQMLAMADLAPGGVSVLSKLSSKAIRAALGSEYGFSDAWTGQTALVKFIDEPCVNETAIEAANRILTSTRSGSRDSVREAFIGILSSTMDETDKAAQQRLLDTLAPASRPRVLMAPSAEILAQKIAKSRYRAKSDDLYGNAVGDLVLVFQASRGQRGRRQSLHAEIRDITYEALCESYSLVTPGALSEVNLGRIKTLLGDNDIEPQNLYGFSALYRAVKPTGYKMPSTRKRPSDTSQALSVADGVALLEKISVEHVLPARGSLDSATIRQIERIFAVPYNADFIDRAGKLGFKRSSMSLNEQHIRDLLGTLSPAYFTDTLVQHKHPDVNRTQPFDFYTRLDDYEILIEAQGQQHFLTESKVYNPVECRRRDRRKVTDLARCTNENLLMLAIHHKLTSGSAVSKRLSAHQLIELVDLTISINAWWCFVRPAGCKDLGVTPRGQKPTQLDPSSFYSDLSDLEVFVLTER